MPLFLQFDFSLTKTAVALLAVLLLALIDLVHRRRHQNDHYLFGGVLGTILSVGIILVTRSLFNATAAGNAHVVAFGILLIFLLWRMLFGPWGAPLKATVLGTFLFWTILAVLLRRSHEELLPTSIAVTAALVPAVIWCLLFLQYHRERLARVLLMFFAGMLATLPVLLYDALVRSGLELHFFLLRVVPENFSTSSEHFISGQLLGAPSISATLLTIFLSFLFVAIIEEGSKYWVLRRSGEPLFTSIDDVMELSIIVAIGFAFAENIVNPSYFVSFVKQYLLAEPGSRDYVAFFGNVAGRSILTSMVHIVSTGVLGYFLGLSLFAESFLEKENGLRRRLYLTELLHRLFLVQRKPLFQREMLLIGFILATLLHAGSNFLVTYPDVLPGNPKTLGDLVGAADASLLHYISLLLIPASLYVVGGFILLTSLFGLKESMKERGRIVKVDTFVREEGST